MSGRLRWDLRYQIDGWSLEAGRRKGRSVPPDHWSHDCPELDPYEAWFLAAFRTLSTGRPLGPAGPGPIPWRDVVDFGAYHQLDTGATDALIVIIAALDVVYLQHVEAQRKKAQGDG